VKYLDASKNNDIWFIGGKMQENKWKGQKTVLTYSLPPLPYMPLAFATVI
jgi:hypothetical protein